SSVNVMEESHQNILQENQEVIAQEIVFGDKTKDFIYALTDKEVLTTQFRDQILLDLEITKINKIRRVVQILQYLGPDAFQLFLQVLVELNLSALASKLDPVLIDQFSTHISRARGPVIDHEGFQLVQNKRRRCLDGSNLAATGELIGVPPLNSIHHEIVDRLQCYRSTIDRLGASSSSTEHDLLSFPTVANMACWSTWNSLDNTQSLEPRTIKVIPAQEIYGTDKYSEDLYKNCSMPRGLVFMANYKDFANDQNMSRHGSEIDVKNLTILFTQMGYKIPKQHVNMTRNETVKALYAFTRDPELQEVDSCIVIIMSHGCDGRSFYTSDNHYLPINDVLEKFNNSQCPALMGKPKIFIFQFCRGPLKDMGVEKQVYRAANSAAAVFRDATFTDMFIIYSTLEGYVSYRHPHRGSWLAEAICDIFMNHAYNLDIDTLMKKVSQIVRKNSTEYGTKQVCEVVSRAFDRHFFFNPQTLQDM
ncbi:unnamed protein product, partial [Meganyctiphanes norvegica]